MKKRIKILNIPIDALTMQETLHIIDDAIKKRKIICHTVVNATKILLSQKDEELYNAIISADIINADGQAVVWASKILGETLPERVTGIDVMQQVVKLAFEKNYKIYFFGAEEDVVSELIKVYSNKYSPDIVAGYRNGYYMQEEESQIVEHIRDSKPDILFVAISSPKKEIFLENYKHIIKVPFVMGVGGSFDVISGKVNRAPKWIQNFGLEWFYRFLQEPKKKWRIALTVPITFIYLTIKEKFFKLKKSNFQG